MKANVRPSKPRTSGLSWYLAAAVLWAGGLVAYPWIFTGFLVKTAYVWADIGHVAYVTCLLATACFFAGLGGSITGLPQGILLGSRNTYSLSRLQVTLWTWVILSALLAVVAARSWGFGGAGISTALMVDIPPAVLSVMGISLSSGVIAPSILAVRSQSGDDPGATTVSRNAPGRATVQGSIVFRPSRQHAQVKDLFRGDDEASAGQIDIGKVQNLMITVLLVAYYAVVAFNLFSNAHDFTACAASKICTTLPDFGSQAVILLLISHGGYLAYKAVPKPDPNTLLTASPGPAPLSARQGAAPVAGGPPPSPGIR